MKKKSLRIVLLALMMPLAIFGQGTSTLNGGKSDCNPITIAEGNPFVENFDEMDGAWPSENNLPDCWGYKNDNEDILPFVIENWDFPSVALFFEVNEGEGSQYAILPEMSNISQVQMTFKAKGTDFSVGVMENGNYVQVKAFEDSNDALVSRYVYFDSYTGSGTQIAIRLDAPQDDQHRRSYLFMDDIEVALLPSCLIPDGLEVVDATQTTLSLRWTPFGDETAWQVQYSNTGGSWNTVNVAASDLVQGVYQLQGLSASMT